MRGGIRFVPRLSDDGCGGPACPGVYRRMIERRCRKAFAPDPRMVLAADSVAEFQRLTEDARVRAAALVEACLVDGQPVEAAWHEVVGGFHGLPRDQVPDDWQPGSVVVVQSDDSVSVAAVDGPSR